MYYVHCDFTGVQLCSTYGHYNNYRPQNSDAKKRGHNREKPYGRNNGLDGGRNDCRGGRGGITARHGGGGRAKWCSIDNTTSHNDQECLKKKINGNTGSANFAKV